MEELKLGEEVRDKVSGYKGIATGRTVYLQGCNRVLVQPKVGKDMTLPEPQSFDEPDLEVIGRGILPEPKPEQKPPGGPRRMASRALEPKRKPF